MAFWKEDVDPWDRKPDRNWLKQKAPKQTPIDSLKQWNDERKSEQARKTAELTPDPIPCPWCGKPMETGYLIGNRGIWWAPGIPNFLSKFISADMAKGAVRVDTEGVLCSWVAAWRCRECEKMVLDAPEPAEDPFSGGPLAEPKESKEEETSVE